MKKILSIILAVVMLFGMAQTAVLAENAEETDVYEVISAGIGNCESYIQEQLMAAHNTAGVTYGYEWYIITMLRAGKSIDEEILEEYYASVTEEVKTWNSEVKPTDAERTILALAIMGKDITNVEEVNIAEFVYNSQKLSAGSNELAYALISLDAAKAEIPDDAVWNRESIIEAILTFQTESGGFGLTDNTSADVDMTAICLQALAPYRDNETVKEATDKALVYLKETISEDYAFTDNVNSDAQVLLAAASFKIDVTNPENGFGNSENNLVTAIEKYRNPDGNGYMYGENVSSLATFQVMQAYDAYRKAHKEDILYWDFTGIGEDNEDIGSGDNPTEPDVESADPAEIYVTIVSDGNIVKDRNDEYVAQSPVTVTDLDGNGILTVDEALYLTHEAYYNGGAEAGYNTFTGTYGLSLGVLWGKGTPGTSAAAGYWLNNASCWSLNDEVREGDYLTAFNYYDTTYWSDSYSYFEKNEVTVKKGSSVTLTLNAMGYDENWNTVSMPYKGAKVKFLDSEVMGDEMITDENGQVEIEVKDVSVGSYYAVAYSESFAIVPTVCKINVIKKSSSSGHSSGGGSVSKVEVKENKEESIVEELTEKENKTDEETEKTVFTDDTFSDVKQDDWYYNSVKYVFENNLMQGTETGFEPERKMTRAMLVTVLYRMANPQKISGSYSFTDVSTDEWYSDAILWAASNGIVNGVSDTEFAPDMEVSREQMAVIMYRFAKSQGYDVNKETDITDFTDCDEISDWAYDALVWAIGTELISGTSETELSPKNASTRAQVATILMRFRESKAVK